MNRFPIRIALLLGLFPTLFLGIVLGAAETTTVYRYVDQAGVIHFSDSPSPGSEKLDVRSVETFPAGRPPVARPGRQREQRAPSPGKLGIHITAPDDDAVLQVRDGSINVGVATDLRNSDAGPESFSVIVYLDGKEAARGDGSGGGFSLSQVYRGSHTLRAELVRGDTLQATSPPVTFHVKRPSKLLLNRIQENSRKR